MPDASPPSNVPEQLSLFDSEPGISPPRDAARNSEDRYWDFCPNCGARLYNIGCKYRCPECHYFMSCSDFD